MKRPDGMYPEGVICAGSGICDVKDPKTALIPEIQRCFKQSKPFALRTYEGDAIFIRTERGLLDESNLKGKRSIAVPAYLDLLNRVYHKFYKKEINVELKKLKYYKLFGNRKPKKYTELILSELVVPEFTLLKTVEENKTIMSCYVLQLNNLLMTDAARYLPPSFGKNLESILEITTRNFNKRIRKGQIVFKIAPKYEKLVPEVELPDIKYYKPTPQQQAAIKKQFDETQKMRRPEFCDETLDDRTVSLECHQKDKSKITLRAFIELSQLPRLKMLDLRKSGIKNGWHLRRLKSLTFLNLTDTPIARDQKQVKYLTKRLPKTKIIAMVTKTKAELAKEAEILEKKLIKGCQKSGKSCLKLGVFYGENLKKGNEAYKKGCVHNNHECCYRLGMNYLAGNGIDEDLEQGEKLLFNSCRADGAVGERVGALYEEGEEGLSQNITKAFLCYEAFCKQKKDGETCLKLAKGYERGIRSRNRNKRLKRNKRKAKYFYNKGCAYGAEDACRKSKYRRNYRKKFRKYYN